MQDIQFKSKVTASSQISGDADYRPNLPNGTLDMFNRAYRAWEIRRGFAEPGFMKSLREAAASRKKQTTNVSTKSAKPAPKKSRSRTKKS
jgi:hypothetical protein